MKHACLLFWGAWCFGVASTATQAQTNSDRQYLPQEAQGVGLDNPSYVVDFDASSGIAHWVHYALSSTEAQGVVPRKDAFRADPRVLSSPGKASYTGSGYDRGHLKPAADSRSSAEEMRASFLMTNMAPQTPNLNRGIWKGLEEAVRAWALTYGEVHVTCGPGGETYDVLASGVRVPTTFWKAVMRTSPDTACVAFVFPNADKVPGELTDYLVTVDALELVIGLDLYPALPDATEGRVEGEAAMWPVLTDAVPQGTKANKPTGAKVQCMGVAKSTGKRCQKTSSDGSGYCHLHRPG